MKKIIFVFIFIPNILFAGTMKVIGVKGNEGDFKKRSFNGSQTF